MSESVNAEGPSFPLTVKLMASALMLALLGWGWRVAGEIVATGSYGFLLATVLVLLSGYWGMLRSRTAINATHITQYWLWTKRVALEDVTQAKLVRLPRLDWLIAPRLMLKVRGRGVYTFHIGDPAVLAMAQRLGLGSIQLP